MLKQLNDLDKTILIEYANCSMNAAKTAEKLHFHRNNITYHLKKVERFTGLNPYNFYELVQILELMGVFKIQCKFFKGKGEK